MDIDRLRGVDTAIAVKAPVLCATEANVLLYGLQIVDGYQLREGDRVLVHAQHDPVENGIWNASAGDWYRSVDANSSLKIATGTRVYVARGNIRGAWDMVITTLDPEIGKPMTWSRVQAAGELTTSTFGGLLLGASNLEGFLKAIGLYDQIADAVNGSAWPRSTGALGSSGGVDVYTVATDRIPFPTPSTPFGSIRDKLKVSFWAHDLSAPNAALKFGALASKPLVYIPTSGSQNARSMNLGKIQKEMFVSAEYQEDVDAFAITSLLGGTGEYAGATKILDRPLFGAGAVALADASRAWAPAERTVLESLGALADLVGNARFVTGDLSYTNGQTLSADHNLGTAPGRIEVTAVCVDDDQGFVAGDNVALPPVAWDAGNNYNVTVWANSTKVYARVGAGGIRVLASGGVMTAAFDVTKWRIKIRCWKLG